MVQPRYDLSLGKSLGPVYESEQQAAQRFDRLSPEKKSSVKVQRYPWASGGHQNTPDQHPDPLKRHK